MDKLSPQTYLPAMRVSKKTEYAVHSVLYIAYHSERTVLLDELALQGVSRDYLAKVMRSLSRAKIVDSSVGAGGGYTLAKPAESITVKDVFLAVEGEPLLKCAYNERVCDAFDKCGILCFFDDAFKAFLNSLDGVNFAYMVQKCRETDFDLDWLKNTGSLRK